MTTFFEIGVCPRPDLSSLFQYTSPTPVLSPHLIPRIQYHPGIPVTLLTGSSFHTFSSVLTGTSIVNAVKNNYCHRQTALGTVNSPLCTDAPCSVLRYLSVTIVTLYPVRHDRYMIVKVHSYVKVVLLIPSTVL